MNRESCSIFTINFFCFFFFNHISALNNLVSHQLMKFHPKIIRSHLLRNTLFLSYSITSHWFFAGNENAIKIALYSEIDVRKLECIALPIHTSKPLLTKTRKTLETNQMFTTTKKFHRLMEVNHSFDWKWHLQKRFGRITSWMSCEKEIFIFGSYILLFHFKSNLWHSMFVVIYFYIASCLKCITI